MNSDVSSALPSTSSIPSGNAFPTSSGNAFTLGDGRITTSESMPSSDGNRNDPTSSSNPGTARNGRVSRAGLLTRVFASSLTAKMNSTCKKIIGLVLFSLMLLIGVSIIGSYFGFVGLISPWLGKEIIIVTLYPFTSIGNVTGLVTLAHVVGAVIWLTASVTLTVIGYAAVKGIITHWSDKRTTNPA